MSIFIILCLISAFSFLVYGITCLTSKKMELEFIRFGMPNFRVFTAINQLISASLIFFGLFFNENFLALKIPYTPILVLLGALNLLVQMIVVTIIRIIFKDSLIETLPAIFYMIINFIIVIFYFKFLL